MIYALFIIVFCVVPVRARAANEATGSVEVTVGPWATLDDGKLTTSEENVYTAEMDGIIMFERMR